MSVFASWLASPPPDAAIEIAPEWVSAAAIGARGRDVVVQGFATQPLPPGAIVPSLSAPNIIDRPAVVAALRDVVGRLGGRPRRIAAIIPDVAARVSLVHFDRMPVRREDLEQLVRWQLKKSAPFPVEDASLSYTTAGHTAGGGGDLLVSMARQDIVREYESVCEETGGHAGLVDLATLGVLNLFLAADTPPAGDWLVVHMRPDYTSIVVLRGEDVMFFRNRPEGDDEALADVVHQTTMYYQDRLAGQGFSRVLLGGIGRTPGALQLAHQSLESRLGTRVEPIDPTTAATLTDRIAASPELLAALAPLVGTLMRTRKETAGA